MATDSDSKYEKPVDKTAVHSQSMAGEAKPEPVPTSAQPRLSGRKPQGSQQLANRLIGIVLIMALAVGGGWLGSWWHQREQENSQQKQIETQRIVLGEQSDLISSIADEVGQSVVSINVTSRSRAYSMFGYERTAESQSAGTGVIISSEGLILTNRHVVPQGTTKVSIVLSDGTEIDDVKVVARTDEGDSLDVAFLQVNDASKYDLKPAKIGNSSKMRVGDSVIAIGNALGSFQNTVTTGIISGYGRSIWASSGDYGSQAESLENLFQTDAAINQGNSGGPLVNIAGEVIGINTAVAGDGAQNIGFAIPIDDIAGLISTVERTGNLARPFLGVIYVAVTADVKSEYDLAVDAGAYIPLSSDYGSATIIEDGPANKAGLLEGDVIMSMDGTAITKNVSLSSVINKHVPGDKVELTVNRKGKQHTFVIELGTRP